MTDIADDLRTEVGNVDIEVPNAYREGVCDGLLSAAEIAQTQAEPARTVPTREEIGEVVCAKAHYDGNCGCGRDDRTADAVLALLADQPTVAEIKAQALEEAAADPDFTAWLESRENKIPAARAWLQHRAELIRDGGQE